MDNDWETENNSQHPEEEVSLPKGTLLTHLKFIATLLKFINDLIPTHVTCPKETRDIISDCGVEFIHLLSSEATEICEKESRKTMNAEHILSALKSLGFSDYCDSVRETLDEFLKSCKERERKPFKLEDSGLSQEELLKSQEELFAKAKARMLMHGQSHVQPESEDPDTKS